MTITTLKKVEVETTIEAPAFWKRKNDYVALIDEDTAIAFYHSESLTAIRHASPDTLKADITDAHKDFDLCDETEWMEKYAEVLKSISLKPVLTIGSICNRDAEDARKSSVTY